MTTESKSITVGNCLVITAIDREGFDVLHGSELVGWRSTEERATILALETTNQELLDLLTHAFGIVCNVDGGDFEYRQTHEWNSAARKFLDDAHAAGVYTPDKVEADETEPTIAPPYVPRYVSVGDHVKYALNDVGYVETKITRINGNDIYVVLDSHEIAVRADDLVDERGFHVLWDYKTQRYEYSDIPF